MRLIDPTFRFHIRCAMYIVIGAAVVTFVGAVLYRFSDYDRIADALRGYDAQNTLLQHQLNRRIATLTTSNAADLAALQQKIHDLSDRETAADAQTKRLSTKAPFPIENVTSSIVELVCIDNADKNTYYTGSGTVFDRRGLIITNEHVLTSGDGSLIRYCGVGFTNDLHKAPPIDYIATALAAGSIEDLAVLKITEQIDGKRLPASFPSISLVGSRDASQSLGLGDPIYIGGYPGVGGETFTFTQGVVSGRIGNDLIKTSALVDSGASGGAAFDANGNYIGVPTAAAAGDIGGSLGYLISANAVDDFVNDFYKGKNALSKETAGQ